jgi:hypothetical protein
LGSKQNNDNSTQSQPQESKPTSEELNKAIANDEETDLPF